MYGGGLGGSLGCSCRRAGARESRGNPSKAARLNPTGPSGSWPRDEAQSENTMVSSFGINRRRLTVILSQCDGCGSADGGWLGACLF